MNMMIYLLLLAVADTFVPNFALWLWLTVGLIVGLAQLSYERRKQ